MDQTPMPPPQTIRNSPYQGQKLALATKHGKERAIARPMRSAAGQTGDRLFVQKSR
jgi:hypothetical protein